MCNLIMADATREKKKKSFSNETEQQQPARHLEAEAPKNTHTFSNQMKKYNVIISLDKLIATSFDTNNEVKEKKKKKK